MLDTATARREARNWPVNHRGRAPHGRSATAWVNDLSHELDGARQTIGVQQAALDGAATTVERYEADLAEACALLSSAMQTAPAAFSYGWIRSAHALLERNAGLIEAHRAPADWGRRRARTEEHHEVQP